MTMALGFLGLGQMGAAIAERLQAAGHTLHVFDPSPAAIAPFVARGAVAETSATAVADAAPLVFACLPNGRVSEAVARDVAAGGAVKTYVEMSTIGSPALEKVRQIAAAKGIALADCPISGGPKGARAGTLTMLCAAPPEVRAIIRPYLEQVGRTIFEIGDRPGQAQLMKLVNNLVNAANMATAFEALVLGAKGGLDPDQMVAVLNVSTGQNSATLTKVPKSVLPGSFDYGSSLTTMLKDVDLGLAEATALEVPMLVHQQVGTLWRLAEQLGFGPQDFTALIKVMESWAGVEVRSRAAAPD
ncbi:NAD(P)-dependent oxidoreductase [Paracraurococcus lichenis]|uniref:NAD(P)-dependent oxidoreductase n=1 Tax=Paracraurococcus lichenis TaxID=3064888 RepID=A0ABT9ED14_9PROT|nr:NAD(P)-dependent oxidoreductase [Paracraurococcus sp. LOR1-02]MDO9714107.1 NAD(P)-dependent oxidoreductase [Paracraurococcus sp. LOR1-02]